MVHDGGQRSNNPSTSLRTECNYYNYKWYCWTCLWLCPHPRRRAEPVILSRQSDRLGCQVDTCTTTAAPPTRHACASATRANLPPAALHCSRRHRVCGGWSSPLELDPSRPALNALCIPMDGVVRPPKTTHPNPNLANLPSLSVHGSLPSRSLLRGNDLLGLSDVSGYPASDLRSMFHLEAAVCALPIEPRPRLLPPPDVPFQSIPTTMALGKSAEASGTAGMLPPLQSPELAHCSFLIISFTQGPSPWAITSQSHCYLSHFLHPAIYLSSAHSIVVILVLLFH